MSNMFDVLRVMNQGEYWQSEIYGSHRLIIWGFYMKKGSIPLGMSLFFVDQPGLEPGTSRL